MGERTMKLYDGGNYDVIVVGAGTRDARRP